MADPVARLRARLVIEAPVEIPDGAGGVVRTFSDAGRVWGAVEAAGAAFRLAAGQAGQTITHRIILRAGPQLSVRHRLRHGTRTYWVRSFDTADPEARFLVALTEEMTG